MVRGIAGNENDVVLYNQEIADLKYCPNIKSPRRIYGDWDNGTRQDGGLPVPRRAPAAARRRPPGRRHDGRASIEAFQADGQKVPPIADGECYGGDLSWWLAHKATYKTVGGCFNGFQGAYMYFNVALRVLAGNGPKYQRLEMPGPADHEREPREVRRARPAADARRTRSAARSPRGARTPASTSTSTSQGRRAAVGPDAPTSSSEDGCTRASRGCSRFACRLAKEPAMPGYEGKVAVITGGASGIGYAIAQRAGAEGMTVVLVDIDAAALARRRGVAARRRADVLHASRPTSPTARRCWRWPARRAMRSADAWLLVNNAGVFLAAPFSSRRRSEWEFVIGVNLWGVVYGLQAFLPGMVERDSGYVVNTSSIDGIVTVPTPRATSRPSTRSARCPRRVYRELEEAGSYVGISVLCPAAVATDILNSARHWPDRLGPAPRVPERDYPQLDDVMAAGAGRRHPVRGIARAALLDPHPPRAECARDQGARRGHRRRPEPGGRVGRSQLRQVNRPDAVLARVTGHLQCRCSVLQGGAETPRGAARFFLLVDYFSLECSHVPVPSPALACPGSSAA